MKKYPRSELFSMCNHGNVQKICEEFYESIKGDFQNIPMHSGDKFCMNTLKDLKERLTTKGIKCSIVIIDHDVPCLVVHRNNDKESDSIYEIRIPFQGEEICAINYKIYSVRDILDQLSYEHNNDTPRFHRDFVPFFQ